MFSTKALLRKSFYVVVFVLVAFLAVSLVFYFFYSKSDDSTQSWEKLERKSELFYRTQDEKRYFMNIKHFTKLTKSNSADVYSFLIHANQKQAAEDSIFAEQILDKQDYLTITPMEIVKFVKDDKSIWNAYILPNEKKWDCYEWQILKKERERLWQDMLDLAEMYDSITFKSKQNYPK